MMEVLTGEEEYVNDSEAFVREAGVMKQNEAAQKRLLGKKTSNRKNKRSNCYNCPNRKRKTLSDSKSDMEVEKDHNLNEADGSDE